MKKGRLFAFALAAMFCMGAFSACGKSQNEKSDEPPENGASDESNVPEESVSEPEMPEYWGFNGYENFVNPDAPEDISTYPTTVTKVSKSKYTVQSETEAGLVTVTLEKRPWGMFNLWAWNLLTEDNKTHVFLSGSTDLEYVFRTVASDGSTVFSGGNHGDEAFVSIDLYNGVTGEKLSLENGESITVDRLHIIEKSRLLRIPDYNGDSIADYDGVNIKEYSEDDVYAEVTRKYTFAGPQVKLNADFDYVKDTKHYYSYTAMFPIDKKYGLWCDMIDRNGDVIKTIETLKVGAGDYSGPQYSGNPATRVILYGYVDPRYQFDIRVNTPEASLGNSENEFKTSIWDMNTTSNKVYFSKYGMNSPTEVKAGTSVHTETVWLFKYVPDAEMPEEGLYKPFEEAEPTGELISRDKEYVISGNGKGYSPYNALLTDGKWVNGLTYDSSWFGFVSQAGNNTVSGVGSVVIDLEEVKSLSCVRVHICNGGEAGICAPAMITASLSEDGENFTDKTDLPVNDTVPNGVYWSLADLSGKNARYVKLDITVAGAFSFINEIEVYGE